LFLPIAGVVRAIPYFAIPYLSSQTVAKSWFT
jgi:hypothetical protein